MTMKILLAKVFIVRNRMISISAKILKPMLLTMFLLSLTISYAQSYNTSSKKSIKNFQNACDEFKRDNFDESMKLVDKALSFDKNFTDAILLKAELFLKMEDDSMAVKMYERLFETDSMAFPRASLPLAKLYAEIYEYEKAMRMLKWFLSLDNQKEMYVKYAERQIRLNEYRRLLTDNPVVYNPKNLGENINTYADEYVNQYYVDDDMIVYTKKYVKDDLTLEDVFVSNITSEKSPSFLLENIGVYGTIGAANISKDAKEIYFSACGWNDSKGSCDIYCIKKHNGIWSEPVNVSSINTSSWESQPCLSANGKELYFVRGNKKNGTSDIYVSMRNENGVWEKPRPVSSNINSEGSEMAPFIHDDAKTLYFSSDFHKGMGGFDLFMSHRDENDDWSVPINLGFPLNTSGDEINLVVSDNAERAFVSSKRSDGFGGYDIYEFELDERFKPRYIGNEGFYADAYKKNDTVMLKNIFFDFDSADLRSDSEDGINAIFDFLISYPDVNILLEGHTDDVGDEDYNLILSENRALSVKTALVDKGIASERIKIKGCGSAQPLFTNNFDDELRALNRRVSMIFDPDI